MKYPAVIMKGEGAKGDVLSIAVAGKGQHQDSGAKLMMLAPNCSGSIVSKSIVKMVETSRIVELVSFGRDADGSKANVECDTIILDEHSKSDTIPYNEIRNDNVTLQHEATVSKVSEDQLFYLISEKL